MSHPRRVFVDFPAGSNPEHGLEVSLSEKDSHHLCKVLRLSEGSQLTAIDRASSQEYDAIICAIQDVVTLRLLSKKDSNASSSRVSSLIFALAKGGNTDLVCEKACELGVRNIILWQSERSVLRVEEKDRAKKLDRWNSIVESAAKQSGNDVIPKVHLVLNLKELTSLYSEIREPRDRAFLCSLSPGSKLPQEISAPAASLHLAVGPEGDFTDKEEAALLEQGFERLSLGPLVLRCETAAIVAISMVHGAWGFLNKAA